MAKVKKLKWSNLKSFQCPKCNEDLQKMTDSDCYCCNDCRFIITKERYEEILKSISANLRKKHEEEDNQSKLSNL